VHEEFGLPKSGQIARFIHPMECLPVEKMPEGDAWTYELKLDGYRMMAVKSGGKLALHSRRGTNMSKKFEDVVAGLIGMPDKTVIDGEVVALDEQGKPNFNLIQNIRSADSRIKFYAFDLLVHRGEDLMKRPLSKRREILAGTLGRTTTWASPRYRSRLRRRCYRLNRSQSADELP
jgi:ATP-dependent DNA ligase